MGTSEPAAKPNSVNEEHYLEIGGVMLHLESERRRAADALEGDAAELHLIAAVETVQASCRSSPSSSVRTPSSRCPTRS
jgi:hypothetical protein